MLYCDEIINSGNFSLNTNVDEIYSVSGWNFSAETIFQLINLPEDMNNGVLTGRLKSTSVAYNNPFDSLVSLMNDAESKIIYVFRSALFKKIVILQ